MAELHVSDVRQRKESAFVDTMNDFQEYLEMQDKLQALLKQGMLDMARAKYSMGAVQMSSEQYDMEMEASTRVTQRALPGDEVGFAAFTLETTLPAAQRAASSSGQQQSDQQGSAAGARQASSTNKPEQAPAKPVDSSSTRQAPRSQDPITWFGVLVPPTLRSAQQSFCKALATAVELSNRQQRCLQRCQQFEELCNELPCTAENASS